MRLVVLSTVLPLVLGVVSCAAPGVDSSEWGSAPADEEAAQSAGLPHEIKAKATEIVLAIQGLLMANRQWSGRPQGAATTPAARRESQKLAQQMRDTLVKLPADAEWVTSYVQENKDAVKAGFAHVLTSDLAKKRLGADKIRALSEAVDRAGGVDAIILQSTATVRDGSREISDKIEHGQKVPLEFLCAVAGTAAGANAAREDWPGVAGPINALLDAGCIH